MVNKYYDGGVVPSEVGASGERVTFPEYDWPAVTAATVEEVTGHMEKMELPKAAAAAVALVVKVDLFITETEPFRMAKDEAKAEELGAVLYQASSSSMSSTPYIIIFEASLCLIIGGFKPLFTQPLSD